MSNQNDVNNHRFDYILLYLENNGITTNVQSSEKFQYDSKEITTWNYESIKAPTEDDLLALNLEDVKKLRIKNTLCRDWKYNMIKFMINASKPAIPITDDDVANYLCTNWCSTFDNNPFINC